MRHHTKPWQTALVTATFVLLPLACAHPQPRHPHSAQPIDEARALAIIARVLQEADEAPAEGRDIRLPTGKALHVDVGTSNHKYGIAYLTESDRAELEAKIDLPPRASGNDFWITQGVGSDADAVILLLDAADYQYDDSAAEPEAAALLVERRLAHDVQEFVNIVRAKKLP